MGLERRLDETSVAYLKRLNAFIYQQKQRILKKNKKAENIIVELVKFTSREQQKRMIFYESSDYFMEVSRIRLKNSQFASALDLSISNASAVPA